MAKVAQRRIADSDRAKRPDFSIPNAAERRRGAALHYAEAARHHREAAQHQASGHDEKASHHTLMAYTHRLEAMQDAEEAAKARLRHHLDDSHQLAKKTRKNSERTKTD